MSPLARFQAELDRLFDEAVRLTTREPRAGEHEPPVDVVETPDEVVVLIEVPGIAREDMELAVEGRTVVLTGTKRHRPPDGARRFHGVEREQGRFERRIELLRPVDTHRGRGRLGDGLLRVSFPRIVEQRAARRPLEIEDGTPPEDREVERSQETRRRDP